MSADDIRKTIYSKIEELPTLPAVLPKILSLVESDRSSAADIAEVISKDPALSAKILKVANSAYYGFSKEITELETAVGLLGLNMVRSLALSIGVLNSLPPGKGRINYSREGLWKHSLASATIMQELRSAMNRWEDGDHLFIAGLLHDVGKVVLEQFFTEKFERALEETDKAQKAVMHLAEKKEIGLDHGEVGAMLLERWRFPEVIIGPIQNHHHRDFSKDGDSRDEAMLRVSDALAYEFGLGEAGNPVNPKIGDKELKLLGLDAPALEKIRERLAPMPEAVDAFYSAVF